MPQAIEASTGLIFDTVTLVSRSSPIKKVYMQEVCQSKPRVSQGYSIGVVQSSACCICR